VATESWYIKGRGPEPLGPFDEERIVRGIMAGKVPLDASVSWSEDGPWKTLLAVPVFASAVHRVLTQREEGTEVRLSADATQNVPANRETTAPSRPAARPAQARLFAIGLLGALLAAAVAVLVQRQPTRSAEGIARQLLGFLAAGDVASLRSRRDLGMSARVSGEVQARGRHELERRQKLLERAELAGARKLLEIERKVIEGAGEATYACLPPEEQRRIREESRTRYILGHGVEALGEERASSLSLESFLDFNQRAVAVNRLGERSLCADERQRLLAQPEDAESQRLARRRSLVGEAELSRLQSRAWTLGNEAWQALAPDERARIARRSLRTYLIDKGFPSLSESDRKLVSGPRVLDDDALAAAARRQLGLPSLAADERADVEALPPDGDAPRQAFLEQQGTRLLADALRQDMSAGGYSLASTVLHGNSPHGLLRSTRATSTLQFEEEREVPARRWLPATLRWRLVDGHYQAAPPTRELLLGDAASLVASQLAPPARELLPLLREVEAAVSPPAQPSASPSPAPLPGLKAEASPLSTGGFFSRETPVVALLLAMLWGLLRRTSEPPATGGLAAFSPDALRWGATALALAALQQLVEGQVNLDDWAFLPLFLAFPCLVGARRGAALGTASGLLAGLALLVGTILFHLPEGHAHTVSVSAFPSGEFLLAGLALGGLGAAAGHLASRPALVALLPLLWVPCSGLFERSHLASLPLYGQASLACAWTAMALGLSLRFSGTSTAAATS
jgi:hypothetical protein